MRRKAQSPTNVLVYILGFMIGALILIYGYRSIAYIMDRGEEAMLQKFETSIKKTIEDTARLPGTVKLTETLTLPTKFTKVCIMDFTKSCNSENEDFKKYGDIICDSYNDQVANIFLLPFETADINIPEIRLNQNPLCIETTGSLKLKVTGQGRTALIEAGE